MNFFRYFKQLKEMSSGNKHPVDEKTFKEIRFSIKSSKVNKIKSAAFFILPAVLFSVSLISCSYPNACYNNLKGVFSYENGNFGHALINYRKAAAETVNNSEYIYYNISRVYHDMGENSASSGILDSLSGLNDKKLEYRINYLKAVIAYNEGRYNDAVLFYKNSIKIDNSDIELLKGLELSFKQLENIKSGEKHKKENSGSPADKDPSESEKRDAGTNTGDRSVSADVLDLLFTEEVILCPGNGDMEQENTPDW